ncbi:MAG: hypothetical protein AABZ60_23175, partial [Planctomycetota bacterium]
MHSTLSFSSLVCLFLFFGLFSFGFEPGECQENPTASFFTSQTVLWSGRTQILPIQLSQPATVDMTIQLISESPDLLDILKHPQFLAGEKIGYARIRTKYRGQTTLRLGTNHENPSAILRLEIRETNSHPEASLQKPTLFGIVPGAYLWGKIAIGVEVFHDPVRSTPDPVSFELKFSTGETFLPILQERFQQEPFLYAFFEIDTNTLAEGSCQITAQVNANGKLQETNPIPITILHPAPDDSPSGVISGECEAHNQGPRPKAYGIVYPKLGSSPEASKETFVLNYGTNPACCISLDIKEAGTYQVALVARGDFAGGAFPTVGLVLNDSPRASTSGQLVHNRWHRIILGHPISLDAGTQILTLLFQNDFYVQALSDRNLYLDRYELIRVDPAKAISTSEMNSGTMQMDSAMSMDSMSMSSYGSLLKNLKITLNRPIDQKTVTGALTINALCSWDGQDKTPEPFVKLWLNDKVVAVQQSGDPLFWIDRSLFRDHENTLFLQASFASGETASTPVQQVYCDEKSSPKIAPLSFYRFTASDSRWDTPSRSLLMQQGRVKVMLFSTNGQVTFDLPEELEGTYDLYLDGQGSNFKGWSEAQVTLKSSEKEVSLKPFAMVNGFAPRKLERVQFLSGKKSVGIAFNNDLYEKEVGDRNLWIRSLILQEVSTVPDSQPPAVTLHYPASDHSVYGGDIVVAETSDNDAINYVDLVIDQKIQLMNLQVAGGAGRFIFPLLARELSPGPHQLMIRAWDRAGNIGESKAVTFNVLAEAPVERTRYARAVHLAKRFAYGPEYSELAYILTMGESFWLEERLSRPLTTGGDLGALEQAVQAYPNDENAGHIIHRVLRHLLLTDNPVRFRFVLWTQNHFSTWMQKASTWSQWDEFFHFLEGGTLPFG